MNGTDHQLAIEQVRQLAQELRVLANRMEANRAPRRRR